MASNSQAVHRRLAELLPEEIYFRFNVIRGLDDIILSDWENSSRISAHTRNYLHEPYIERDIKDAHGFLFKVRDSCTIYFLYRIAKAIS
jgi:hypothetical protein